MFDVRWPWQGGGEQKAETQRGSAAEGAAERIDQSACRSGQLVMQAAQLTSDDACLAGLAPSPLASLGLGQSSPLAYAGHHSLLVSGTGCVLFP
jgi:hypothetical protein